LNFFFSNFIVVSYILGIEPGDIRTMSKYPRKMDEVIDVMGLIVLVWRQRRDWYRTVYTLAYRYQVVRAASQFRGSYKCTKLVESIQVTFCTMKPCETRLYST
jgi:hypothetical protein